MKLKAFLKLTSGNNTETIELNVGESISFGRSSKSTKKLSDEKLSGQHCELTLNVGYLELHDMGSKNGTFLNKVKIDKGQVYVGDEIRIGNTKITLDPSKMDEFSKSVLAYQGKAGFRASKDIKVDHTTVRNLNEINRQIRDKSRSEHAKKNPVAPTLLSKDEIKSKNKVLSWLGNILDLGLVLGILTLPIFIINYLIEIGGINVGGFFIDPKFLQNEKTIVTISACAVFVYLFYFINFKLMEFSIGEKLMGIQRKCNKQ
jgi:pSer/pThr/pTyr-binding forkhead associated (FHA) protein